MSACPKLTLSRTGEDEAPQMKERHLMREARRQHFIKLRLAEAQARTGFSVPTRVQVSLEQLQEIEAQLKAHLALAAPVPSNKLN